MQAVTVSSLDFVFTIAGLFPEWCSLRVFLVDFVLCLMIQSNNDRFHTYLHKGS